LALKVFLPTRNRVNSDVRRALAPLAPAEWARDSIEQFWWRALAMLAPPNYSMETLRCAPRLR